MPTVSVIIPVYNVENYIRETIESVLDQNYQDFEILVVDDGSPDRSIEIVQQFADPRIKILRQANGGLASARNCGIRQASGEYIAFLDADDRWMPEMLQLHLNHLEQNPEIGVSFSPSTLIDLAGKPLSAALHPKLHHIQLADLFRCNVVGNGSAAVVRQAVCTAVKLPAATGKPDRYFHESLRANEDTEFWLRIAIQTHWKIEGIPQPLTQYRVNPHSLSRNFAGQLAYAQQALEIIRTYAPDIADQWGKVFLAYQLRYLARHAIRHRSGIDAVAMIHQALSTYPALVWEEPRRTLLTWATAQALRLHDRIMELAKQPSRA
jgi:glycosyltransferase involved in cell wall biosynthesis